MSETPLALEEMFAADDAHVSTERRGAVLVVTLDRPEKLNAWTPRMEREFGAAMALAEADEPVRAVVITGAGRAFCAGADMGVLDAVSSSDEASRITAERPTHVAATLRKPVIAAMHGAAAGIGMVQALYADVRFASPSALFLTAFAHRGLIAEYGVAWILPRLIGHSRASDLLLSSRKVGAEEALRIGLVDHLVDDPLEAAIAYAEDLATRSAPSSMATIKEQLRLDAERSFAASVEHADALMRESFEAPDLAEGVASFTERRDPAFAPLPAREI